MRDLDLKALAVAALRPAPDFSGLARLRDCREAEVRRLLRWLDQSGLALYLFSQLQRHGALDALPAEFRQALERRLSANRERTADMLMEFGRLVESFRNRGVRFCALKGFTLTPDFCPAPHLRHQTDLDFLVEPESMEDAKQALLLCGYVHEETRSTGEVTFATPLRHIPSAADDIYARPRHREVDLLLSLRHEEHGASIDGPSDCRSRAQSKTLQNVSFPSLSADDMFYLQVMHAFKHLLGSWIRVSWLVEIGYFIDLHHRDADLWRSVTVRAGQDQIVQDAFGLIISLTQTLFPRPIPRGLDEWCLQPLSTRIETWVRKFGLEWATSDLDGAKLTLFVHREFIRDSYSWNSYVLRRIFPIGRHAPFGRVSMAAPGARIKASRSQWLHSLRRAIFHTRELMTLPVHAIRWKHALRSTKRQRTLVAAGSD
jgi:Uncharacterised nucleotidyltransferase